MEEMKPFCGGGGQIFQITFVRWRRTIRGLSEWKVMELQLNKHVKNRQTITFLLRIPVGRGDIPRGSGNHLENGGKTIFS